MEPRASPEEARSPPQTFSTPPTSIPRKRLRSPNESPMSPSDTPVPVRRRAASLVVSPLSGLAEEEEEEVFDAISQGADADVDMLGADGSPASGSSKSLSRSPSPSQLVRNLLPIFAHAAMLLANINDTLRRHRADIGDLSLKERGQCWATISGGLDSLNATVRSLSGDFAHVGSVMGDLTDNLAELERRFGRAPEPDRQRSHSPLTQPATPIRSTRSPSRSTRSPPRSARSPSPPARPPTRSARPPLQDRIGTGRRPSPIPPSMHSSPERSVFGEAPPTDDWTDWASAGFDTADEDLRSISAPSRDPSRPPPTERLPLEQRISSDTAAPRPASRAASAVSGITDRSASRGRSPAPTRKHRPPPHQWQNTLFVVFSSGRPAPEEQLPIGVMHTNLDTAFERSRDLQHVRVSLLVWSSTGNITIVLSVPPTPDIITFVRARFAALYPEIPRDGFEVRTYRFRSCLGFFRVPCVDASFNDISPRAAAKPIFDNRGLWGEVASRPTTQFRWGISRAGDTSRELVVEVEDDSSHTIGDQLLKQPVIFDCGPLRPHIMRDRRLVIQCGQCFRWGHPTRRCAATRDVCVRCSGNHKVAAHSRVASCCNTRPDRNSTPCPHPPVCVNCHGGHYANDRVCEFFKHRSDHSWYVDRIPNLARINATLEERITTADNVPSINSPATEAERTVRFGAAATQTFHADSPPQNAGNHARAQARGGRRTGASRRGRGRT
ncbi:hypothetical protein C2E23DRAFT_815926 [Lenzites betulinus]|nr:hypothetical protein C2E23DRAFT_815926 [Lenzites betulinus]